MKKEQKRYILLFNNGLHEIVDGDAELQAKVKFNHNSVSHSIKQIFLLSKEIIAKVDLNVTFQSPAEEEERETELDVLLKKCQKE